MKFVLLALFVAAVAAVPAEKSVKDVEASPIIMPAPASPEVVEDLPMPQGLDGEIFNKDNVQVSVNVPEDSGMFSTLQSWFNMAINYISNGVESSQQIV